MATLQIVEGRLSRAVKVGLERQLLRLGVTNLGFGDEKESDGFEMDLNDILFMS